jgi:hypothetical protein
MEDEPSLLKGPSPEAWLQMQSSESAKLVSELRPELAQGAASAPPTPKKPTQDFAGTISPFVEKPGDEPFLTKYPPQAPVEKPPEISGIPETKAKAPPPGAASRDVPDFPKSPASLIPGMMSDTEMKQDIFDGGFDKGHLKPKGLIQVACIYPEGQEKQGQQFVSKLKNVCGKLSQPITVVAVLVQPWVAGQEDAGVWARSAQLSGADVLFVFTTKTGRDKLRNVPQETAKVGLKGRLILLEQIGLRALYADVVAELQRMK